MKLIRTSVAAALVLSIPVLAHAVPIVWVGGGANDVNFSKAGGADETLPGNQDRITANVWLTRDFSGGLYNVLNESGATRNVTPTDTEWAFSGLGGNGTFAYGSGAGDWTNLTFADFTTSLANQVGNNVVNTPGVLHLITDDIYMDIVVTTWTASRPNPTGGGVGYTRAPEPASLALLAIGGLALIRRKR